MKQYIKPQTEVQNVIMAKMVCTSLETETKTTGSYEGGAKSRDVWSDGFWD